MADCNVFYETTVFTAKSFARIKKLVHDKRITPKVAQLMEEINHEDSKVIKNSNRNLVFQIDTNASLKAQLRELLLKKYSVSYYHTSRDNRLKFFLNLSEFPKFIESQMNFIEMIQRQPYPTQYVLHLTGINGVADIFPQMLLSPPESEDTAAE